MQPESPRQSHDGTLWPVPRDRMRVPEFIVTRMVLDMRSIRMMRDDACIYETDMRALGWSEAQLALHGPSAKIRLLRPRSCGPEKRNPQPLPALSRRFKLVAAGCYCLGMACLAIGIYDLIHARPL